MVAAAAKKEKKTTTTTDTSPVRKRPRSFFKVLLGDFAHQLRIPPKFARFLSADDEEEQEAATLVGPAGGKWEVELEWTREGVWFAGDGWRRFAAEHSLKELEFLVLQYDGRMRFTVSVFGTHACEREDLLPPIRPRPQGKPLPECGIAKVRIKQEKESPQICVVYTRRRNHRVANASASLPRRIRRVISRQQRLKAEKAANSFTSLFPFCIKRMYSINVGSKYTLVKLILRDPNGKPWVVHYIPKSRDRDRLSTGWSEFACGNSLETGDYCVFELVAPVEMQVHIFRVQD